MQGSLGEACELSFAGYSERNSNLVRFRNGAIRRTPISHPGNGASAPTRQVMKRRNIAIRSPNITHILFFELQMRSEEHTSELQSLMRISYDVFCLKKKKTTHIHNN